MATHIDKEAIAGAYDDVRNDGTDTNWAFFGYEGVDIVVVCTGTEYDEFLSKFEDDQRAFGFVRIVTGDEMSKRAKFAMITWIGPEVAPLKRAKVSTDKLLIKQILQNFVKEIQTNDRVELDQEYIRQELTKAGGANYGTGNA